MDGAFISGTVVGVRRVRIRTATCRGVGWPSPPVVPVRWIGRGGGSGGSEGGGGGGDNGKGGGGLGGDGFHLSVAVAAAISIARARDRSLSNGGPDLKWTYILIALNAGVFLAQCVMGERLTMMGAKVNRAIVNGQLYRLLTAMFLHGSIGHLLINCFSTYSLGPTVEAYYGKSRFIALYLFAGLCGNLASFYFLPQPSIGASGAVFGLLGALGLFLLRHKKLIRGSERNLSRFGYIIIINLAMGLRPNSQIDNFGHMGGLVGGVIFGYLFGPNLSLEYIRGRPRLVDRPVLPSLVGVK